MANQKRRKKLTAEEEQEVINSIEKTHNENFLNKLRIDVKPKTNNQKKLISEIRNKEITICSGLPGTGKAQPLDSLVLTPNGFIEMGKLKINDTVLTPDNKTSRIVGIYPQGVIPIYRITFSDGSNTECSSDHLWKTQTVLDRQYQKFNRTDGKKIYYSEKGRDGSVKTTKEICDTLTYHGKTNHSIPMVTKLSFNEKTLPVKPYLLGLLLGDGGLTTNVGFSTIDLELLDSIKSHLPNNIEYKLTKNGKCDYKIVTDRGFENPLLIELDKLGLRGLKSEFKFIPNEYLYGSINDRISLLQGLMDTDGTIDKRSGSIVFYSTSKRLSNDVRFIVESLGGVCSLSQKIGSYKKDGVVIKCKVCYCLSISLPNNIAPFRLERKLSFVKPKTKYIPKRFITNIEYIGDKEAQCIAIDDDSHLYITNNFIVTHNTFLSCAVALDLLKNDPRYKKIIIIKSVTTLKDEEIGFLKGNLKEKMEPFMYSFIHNFQKVIGEANVSLLRNANMIEELPIAYMRGINIDNSITIIDEAQNISVDNIRTIMTRLGQNSKMIFLGDENQIDMKRKSESSLNFIINKFSDFEEVGTIVLGEDDVVRNPLIKKIEQIFRENT